MTERQVSVPLTLADVKKILDSLELEPEWTGQGANLRNIFRRYLRYMEQLDPNWREENE